MLVDSHCHLEWESFDADRDAVLARARKAGVIRALTVGTNATDAVKVTAIAERYEDVYAAFAIHPHDAKDADENTYARLAELARHPKVVAYGEIGLDFFKNYSPHDRQRAAFRRQIALARELGLPIVIHDRDAHEEILDILREAGGPYRGVFHCFAGDEAMAREVLALGFHLSFTGNITFGKKMKSHRVIRMCPLDRLLIETDAPFLTPEPHRGQRNEPAYVAEVAARMATLREMSVADLARETTTNAYRLFKFENAHRRPAVAYHHKDALYLNLTSRCTNRCTFCAKHPDFVLGPHYLFLEPDQEPTVAAVLDAVGDASAPEEIVFCGFGEPTLRWDDLLAIARELKARGARRIRLNTNGQAALIQGREVAAEMAGAIDALNVSLNAPDAATYRRLCAPNFGDAAFAATVEFIAAAKRYVPEVVASVVRVDGLDLPAVRRLAEETLGVPLRVRG